MRFRKKPVVIEATKWFKNGDHPEDEIVRRQLAQGEVTSEGKVVRFYRRPDDPGGRLCNHCSKTMHEHGWVETLEGGGTVCPGDWIITGVQGEHYPCKPDVFLLTYEPLN